MDTNEPLLRVVRGSPTPEELAALVTVVYQRLRAPAAQPPAAPAWARSARPAAAGGVAYARGPHAWRRSALPRAG